MTTDNPGKFNTAIKLPFLNDLHHLLSDFADAFSFLITGNICIPFITSHTLVLCPSDMNAQF